MLKSMLTRLREDRAIEDESAEAGFTLIELMVVLLIIAILLAIAIPTFLGVTGSANDRAAQSNLTNGLTELKALYQNDQTYCAATATCGSSETPLALTTIQSSAPEFKWVAAGTDVTVGNNISIQPVDVGSSGDGQGVVIATLSKNNNTCWYAVDLEATPIAAFSPSLNPDFAAGTSSTYQWNSVGAATVSAGVFYAKVPQASHCDANIPTTTGSATAVWNWGTSYSNAPTS
jgi:prepilin-type N-terminal cleavage/methylation domain-containing protein